MTREELIEAIIVEMSDEKKAKWKSRAKKAGKYAAVGAGIGLGTLAVTKGPQAKRHHDLGKRVTKTAADSVYRQALVTRRKGKFHVDKYTGVSFF